MNDPIFDVVKPVVYPRQRLHDGPVNPLAILRMNTMQKDFARYLRIRRQAKNLLQALRPFQGVDGAGRVPNPDADPPHLDGESQPLLAVHQLLIQGPKLIGLFL